jgi:hypothetical protein
MTENNSLSPQSEPEPQTELVPDDGMNTSSGEDILVEPRVAGEPPEIVDGGMSAGFEFHEDLSIMVGEATSEPEIPPAEAMHGAKLFSEGAYMDPDPAGDAAQPQTTIQNAEQAADPQMVSFFITDERLETLWTRADLVKQSVDEHVQSTSLAKQAFDLVKFTRNELMSSKDRYEEAERYMNEAEFLIDQNQRMRSWSFSYGLGIFIYELLWTVGIAVALFLLEGQHVFDSNASDFIYLLGSVVWGCLGGVMGALFALIIHVSKDQDFDRQFTLWYINSPMMGMGIGAVVFTIMRVGLLSLTMSGSQQIGSPIVIYILSWLCGYQHNVFTDIVKRVLKVFESEAAPSNETPSRPPEAGS